MTSIIKLELIGVLATIAVFRLPGRRGAGRRERELHAVGADARRTEATPGLLAAVRGLMSQQSLTGACSGPYEVRARAIPPGMRMIPHELHLAPAREIYWATCACGWRSEGFAFRGDATRSARRHCGLPVMTGTTAGSAA